MTKPRTDLLPWDCLSWSSDLTINDLLKVMRLYWTRKIDHVPPALPRDLLLPVARVLTMGAEKYVARGWETDSKYHTASQHFASFMRHAASPELLDAESGLPNTWHMACRYIMLAALQTRGVLVDDRPPAQPNAYEQEIDGLFAVEGQGEGGLAS